MRRIRRVTKSKSAPPPTWMRKEIFEELWNIWVADKYKDLQANNRRNRMSDRDGLGVVKSTAGSISIRHHAFRMRNTTLFANRWDVFSLRLPGAATLDCSQQMEWALHKTINFSRFLPVRYLFLSSPRLQIILICSIGTVRYNHKAKTTNSLSSLFRHPQPSFAESSLRIRTALQSGKWSKEMEMKLQNLVIVLNNYVVNQVLKSLLDSELGFHFYLWAESQRGFKHNHFTIKSMICLLLKCQRFDLLSVILRKLHDDGFTPHRSIYRILISGHVKCGLLSFAFETFDEMIMSSCRVFSVDYNKFIGVLIKNRCFDLAEKYYNEMIEEGQGAKSEQASSAFLLLILSSEQQMQLIHVSNTSCVSF
ncbi:hypothetical protein KSP40_PGU006208 [Platanthera guangdongensis]|uniref:Pentatricopeptide repeat-containing protein n=1 Tax=Platanthera guangdongensis TaxID=2320717 RepID=A0ABR2MT29_9ASPA